MQVMLKSSTGLKVRSHCRVGYYSHEEGGEKAVSNNECLKQRDDRTVKCNANGWNPGVWECQGNNNGKELDRCMFNVWSPGELVKERPTWFGPYYSENGDKCFNEFIDRYKKGTAIGSNKEEWGLCTATVS